VIVLDTDLLTLIQRRAGPDYERLVARLDDSNDKDVKVTIISFEEQMRGWLVWIVRARTTAKLIDAYSRLAAMVADFKTRPIVDFDRLAYAEYVHLLKSKIRIGTMDLRIAVISLANDALLLSRNLRDFSRVPRLRVEDWTELRG
jgi:tRNA(fMet)-specific endonuclease VapC